MRFNMDSFSDVFERVKELCRGEMSEVAYGLWIKDLELISLDGETARLMGNTKMKRDIADNKYNALLASCFEQIIGFPVKVEIYSRETLHITPPKAITPCSCTAAAAWARPI